MKDSSAAPAVWTAVLGLGLALPAMGWQVGGAGGGVQPQAAEAIPSVASIADSFAGVLAVTAPSRDSTLSYTFPTEIGEILVIGGQKVKKGDVLVRGRDEEYRFQRDLQQLLAESDLDIQKAQAAVDQAQVEFESQEKLYAKKAERPLEYDQARTLLTAKKVDLEIARLQYRQQKIQLQVREAQLERLTLKAPFDGTVDLVTGDVGEVKKETEPIVRVVATDPLWMDVYTSIEQTLVLGLKPGDKAWVLMDLPGQPRVHIGKVIEVGADAAFEANKRRVRVALPNPEGWPSGPAAWVRFTAPEGEWAKRVVEPRQQQAGAVPQR